MKQVDALIIGGGPAGLAAAIVLASGTHGHKRLRVLLCEQKQFPVDKACGEGIMPTGVYNLCQLGVKLEAANYFPFTGIRYHSPGGTTAMAEFAEGSGWGVQRTTLSAALLRRAQEFTNLEICMGKPAKLVERSKKSQMADGTMVQIGREYVQTRLLIGADGLNSSVRRWACLERREERSPGKTGRWGARQHFRLAPWSEQVEVYWGNGLEAYITPCGPELVDVAFLWDRARYRLVQGGEALFPSLLQAFPHLGERLARAGPVDKARAIGPLQRAATSPVADGVLLLGDAAGYLDAITGEGISLATAEALALAQTVVPRLYQPGVPTAKELAPYVRLYEQIVRPYYQLTRLVLWLSHHPVITEQVIRLLKRQPRLFQRLLSANMGLVSPWMSLFYTPIGRYRSKVIV